MGVRAGSLILGTLALLLVSFIPAPVSAAVATCTPEAAIDPAGDVVTEPAAVPDAANGFNRLDIQTICITETASATLVVLGVGGAVNSILLQEYHWRFTFKVGTGAEQFASYTHMNGANGSTPPGAEHTDARIQFKIPKSVAPVGSRLNGMYFNSTGQFIDQNGSTVVGSDRGPNAGAANIVYVVGTNSPAGTDTDQDGVDDATEVKNGTDPGKADTDGDGLKDGEEKAMGTNATRADTDGDGLLDGAEKALGADPKRADTDDDGLNDKEEATGSRNQAFTTEAFIAGAGGSTNPAKADTDGDGLNDGDEVSGRTQVDGQLKPFAPTDPNTADTDGDGLSDAEEVKGFRTQDKTNFKPTDPTKKDTDGDGRSDFDEVEAKTDPTNGKDPAGTASDAVTQYLPFSFVLLAVVVLISAGGIFWRWG